MKTWKTLVKAWPLLHGTWCDNRHSPAASARKHHGEQYQMEHSDGLECYLGEDNSGFRMPPALEEMESTTFLDGDTIPTTGNHRLEVHTFITMLED